MTNRNRTKYTVLGMLALENLTGYQIIKMIKSSTNYFWSESEGQIYPTLSQCVEEGFATCKETTATKTQRVKKIYAITAKGKKELNAWLKKESQPSLVRNELLLKLFFGGHIDDKENVHHLTHRQKEIELQIESYQSLYAEIIKTHKKNHHVKYWLITLDFGIKSLKAELAWCKDTLKILNKF